MGHDARVYDITIVGGGPVGLYGCYTAGMRGMSTKLIESLPQLGGQLMALYPEKYIYDVAGYHKVLAKDLARECVAQGLQHNPTVCLEERLVQLGRGDDGVFRLGTDKGTHLSRVVVLSMGKGAFSPRKLGAPGEEELIGKGVYYGITDLEALKNKRVLIVGGGDSAVDWALMLKDDSEVTLIHRRPGFRAHEESVNQLFNSSVNVMTPYQCKAILGADRVEGAVIFHSQTNEEQTLAADVVILSLGFLSSLGAVHDWGLEMEGDCIRVRNFKMETSIAGVYACGDVAEYDGKVKLIATGFGEIATAVNNAKAFIDPTAKAFPGHSSSRGS